MAKRGKKPLDPTKDARKRGRGFADAIMQMPPEVAEAFFRGARERSAEMRGPESMLAYLWGTITNHFHAKAEKHAA